jgi:hypothetical protein
MGRPLNSRGGGGIARPGRAAAAAWAGRRSALAALFGLGLLAALAGGCENGNAGTSLDAAQRERLEQERRRVEDNYAETLRQQKGFQAQDLDARRKAADGRIASLGADLTKVDQTQASLTRQLKTLLDQPGLASTTQPGQPGQPGKDWADQIEGLRLMLSQADLDRVMIQAKLVKAQEELAELRSLLAQRENLARDARAQEDRLIALKRKLD